MPTGVIDFSSGICALAKQLKTVCEQTSPTLGGQLIKPHGRIWLSVPISTAGLPFCLTVDHHPDFYDDVNAGDSCANWGSIPLNANFPSKTRYRDAMLNIYLQPVPFR